MKGEDTLFQSLIKELNVLETKIDKLDEFLSKHYYTGKVPEDYIELLEKQSGQMRKLRDTLRQRIGFSASRKNCY